MRWRFALAVIFATLSFSCASTGYTPDLMPMPAARAGLPPQTRFFYDALAEDGEWLPIEPYGWVFRPRMNGPNWQPYRYGYWVPSDVWGWTWISTESFGWATYHYGRWLYDSFQHWVWIPGEDWAPAWVSWYDAGDYIGWSPLAPGLGLSGGSDYGTLYAPVSRLTAADLSSHVQRASDPQLHLKSSQPIENVGEAAGVRYPRGPRFERIERALGQPLTLAKVDVQVLGALSIPARRVGSPGRPAAPGRPIAPDSLAEFRRATREAVREARLAAEAHAPAPPAAHVIRPRLPGAAAADSTL